MFSALKGDVRLCDPYVDHSTIEHLCVLDASVPVRILSVNIKEVARLTRTLQPSTLKIDDDVNVLWVVHPAMLDDSTLYIIGTSLNGLGKKQAFLIRAGSDFRDTMISAFEALWSSATPWP